MSHLVMFAYYNIVTLGTGENHVTVPAVVDSQLAVKFFSHPPIKPIWEAEIWMDSNIKATRFVFT